MLAALRVTILPPRTLRTQGKQKILRALYVLCDEKKGNNPIDRQNAPLCFPHTETQGTQMVFPVKRRVLRVPVRACGTLTRHNQDLSVNQGNDQNRQTTKNNRGAAEHHSPTV